MKKFKFIAACAAVITLITLLCSCGGGSETSESKPESGSISDSTSSTDSTPESASESVSESEIIDTTPSIEVDTDGVDTDGVWSDEVI